MIEQLHAAGLVVVSLLATAMIILSALGIGSAILRALQLETRGVERVTWSVTLGLVTGGMILALLGLLGQLYAPLVGGLSVVATVWGLGSLYRWWLEGSADAWLADKPHYQGAEPIADPSAWLLTAVTMLAVGVGVTSLVAALAPPTAGDALCYHLELPKEFLADHRLSYLPYHDNSTFPLLGEMWFAWGLALDGPVTAQLVAWCCGWLLAGATFVLAEPLLGRRWAEIAGLATVLVPGLNNHMAAPLVDVPTALLTTLMLAAWLRAAAQDQSRNWLVIAGCLLGGACGVKYVGLVWAAAWLAVVGIECCRQAGAGREILCRAGVVLVIAASVGGMWYVRAAWHRGDPVWPFFSAWLPSSVPPPQTVDKTQLGLSPIDVVTAPWQLTMHPEGFGGRGHRLGVMFLLLLPGLLTARRLRGLAPLGAAALVYSAGWYLLRQNVRFLYPIAPLLIVAATWSFIELARWPTVARRLAIGILAAMLAMDSVGPLLRARDKLAVAVGWESRDAYLLRKEPTYGAACVVNTIARPPVRILSQDYRAFYFEDSVIRESVYRRVTGYDRVLAGKPLAGQLRARGFTHLLLVGTSNASGVRRDTTLADLVDRARRGRTWSDCGFVVLNDYEFMDSDGVLSNYRLIELR